MKIAILNDTHCGVRNSSDIFLDYQGKFYSDVFFPYLKENNIKHIIHLGDYYDHRKYVNFKAQNHNRQSFLNVLKSEGITMDIIPGNHDVFYKNTNDLCSLKELLGYYTVNVNIVMKPTVMDYDGCQMALVPWINSENYADTVKFLQNCKASVVGAHLELSGFEMYKGLKSTHGMDSSLFSRFESVLSGHYHTKSSNGNIHYLGSQMEFNWADVDDKKYFHIFDTESREITPVHNPITLFRKVYYDDTKIDYNTFDTAIFNNCFVKIIVVNKTEPFMFDKFLDRIQEHNIHELKIAESFDEFLGDNVDDSSVILEDTTQLIDTYVDVVDTDLDKNRIKELMRGLYVEACNMDIAC